jgi:adenine-specific DNA methylase
MHDTPAIRKARGAFFTPSEITRFLTEWAVRAPKDVVLEPSCGEACFLLEAGFRLRRLGAAQLFWENQLHGVEIHPASADTARVNLAKQHFNARISVGDFFDVPPQPVYDAVVGNPPYVRYQQFTGNARAKGLQAALAQGVRLTGLASSWAAFVVHGSQFLKPSGRFGLVLPAELLSVKYASQVRRFLLDRFASVRLVMFENRVFPGVLEEVILLLAEGSGGAKNFEVYQARNLEDLTRIDAAIWTDYAPSGGDKWTPALLTTSAFSTYQRLTTRESFAPLLEWGETYLGAVTGNNNFFSLTRQQATKLGLNERELLPISPPGSRHLKGLKFSQAAWQALAGDDARCYLFNPEATKLSVAARRYIEEGKKAEVDEAYKCANRSPWWRVPTVAVPDILFTYMNHDRPRLITNDAGVHIVNSVYGIALRHDRKRIGRDLLPIACLNSVTLLGAEIVGRAYGGGLLKMEPKEADLLPVPSERLVRAAAESLRLLRPQLAMHLRQGDLQKVVQLVDDVLLTQNALASENEIQALRQARETLFQRRRTRGRSERGAN